MTNLAARHQAVKALSSLADATGDSTIQDATNKANSALGRTINLYQQIFIPSPLYPIVEPVCVSV